MGRPPVPPATGLSVLLHLPLYTASSSPPPAQLLAACKIIGHLQPVLLLLEQTGH